MTGSRIESRLSTAVGTSYGRWSVVEIRSSRLPRLTGDRLTGLLIIALHQEDY